MTPSRDRFGAIHREYQTSIGWWTASPMPQSKCFSVYCLHPMFPPGRVSLDESLPLCAHFPRLPCSCRPGARSGSACAGNDPYHPRPGGRPLYGPWKFTVGDSPIDPATHTPLWADPGFDDSKWETVDLTPRGALDPLGGFSNYVKGWTARGHAGHWGYAWYRIRVQVAAMPGEDLALAGSADVDDAYQFFSNGSLVGSFGSFTGSQPKFYYTQPVMFKLPPAPAGQRSDLSVEVRVLFGSGCPLYGCHQSDLGGFHTRRCWAARTRFRRDTNWIGSSLCARKLWAASWDFSSSCSPSSPSA